MTKTLAKYDDPDTIGAFIFSVRGQKVILDADLARIYGVATKVLNQAVKRNRGKFPADFMFRLAPEEAVNRYRSRSQFVTLKRGHNIKYLPYVFTEHGAIMAANVLNSPEATDMSVFVVRAFVRMRRMLTDNRDLARKLAELEKMLTARLDTHERVIVEVLQQVMRLLNPPEDPESPPEPEEETPKRMGFHACPESNRRVKEGSPRYGRKRRREARGQWTVNSTQRSAVSGVLHGRRPIGPLAHSLNRLFLRVPASPCLGMEVGPWVLGFCWDLAVGFWDFRERHHSPLSTLHPPRPRPRVPRPPLTATSAAADPALIAGRSTAPRLPLLGLGAAF